MQNEGQNINKEQIKELALTYRPKAQNPELTVKRFLKNEEVKDYANIQLAKILTDNNITIDWIIKEQKGLLELSKENKQLNVTHKVIESLKNDLGLNDKVKVTETRQFKGDLDQVYKTVQEVKAERGQIAETNEDENG